MHTIRRPFAVVLFLVFIASFAFSADHVVIKPVVNMYHEANEDTDVVSQAIYGTNVSVLQTKGEWTNIRTPDDYTGWVRTAELRALPQGRTYATSGHVAEVWNRGANIYREKDVTAHAPVITVPFETRLEVASDTIEDGERWLQVRLADDRTAWVQHGDIVLDPKPMSLNEMLDLAKRFLGVTYTWGGTSSFGYDCSGFVQMLMRHRGYIFPRDGGPQAAWTGFVAVDRDKLQPGDVLYFGGSPENITHTGMYIGDGKFIHDTTYQHPMVQISDLKDERWTKLLVAARRLK
jgi:hypothetical protein